MGCKCSSVQHQSLLWFICVISRLSGLVQHDLTRAPYALTQQCGSVKVIHTNVANCSHFHLTGL